MSHEPGRERHMQYFCEHCNCQMDGLGTYNGKHDEYWCERCLDTEGEEIYMAYLRAQSA